MKNKINLECLFRFEVVMMLEPNVLLIKFLLQNAALHQCSHKQCFLHEQRMQKKMTNGLRYRKKQRLSISKIVNLF